MKNQLKFRFIFLTILSVFLLSTGFQNIYAQKAKKQEKVRVKVQPVNIVNGEVSIEIKAIAKIDGSYTGVENAEFTVYNDIEEEAIKLGKTITNQNGEATYILKNINLIKADTSGTYNITVKFKGNDDFKRASKSVSFKNAFIKTTLSVKDSINYISATLIDVKTDLPIPNRILKVQVQRLFKALKIGDEYNITDENGTVIVPIDNGIPGVDGNLTFEVVLSDTDDYGTVKAIISAPLGTPIVDESTFDQRTLWSPRSKTPLFLLIFPNILIFGIWGIIVYLITNLIKINKS